MGKIGQNPKIGQLTPRSSATVRRTEKLTRLWKLPNPCAATRGKQCIPWLVAWSEWGACLTDFRKCLSGFIDGTPTYVSRPNLVKIRRCEVAERSRGLPNKKNFRSAGFVLAPILAQMGRSSPNFPECCHPLTCPRIPNLFRIGCVLMDLFQKG